MYRTHVRYTDEMGYGGKVVEQEAARRLRASGMTMPDIAAELGVSKSSVSLWVRDVPVPEMQRRRTRSHTVHPAAVRRQAEIAEMNERGVEHLGRLQEQAFLAAGVALYAGEGTKRGGAIGFANTNPEMVLLFVRWLRRYFEIDESRMRAVVYLHEELDLDEATAFWSDCLSIPLAQFLTPHIVRRTATVRKSRHERGCVTVKYSCSRTHREVMGLVRALLSSELLPG